MKTRRIEKPEQAEHIHAYETKRKVCRYWGITYNDLKSRRCLSCGEVFLSTGNRICKPCHNYIRKKDLGGGIDE